MVLVEAADRSGLAPGIPGCWRGSPSPSPRRVRRKLTELDTTAMEEHAIMAPAAEGSSENSKEGRSTPAASGMPIDVGSTSQYTKD
eukprot:2025835-Pyramimonas_sp.AAC.1